MRHHGKYEEHPAPLKDLARTPPITPEQHRAVTQRRVTNRRAIEELRFAREQRRQHPLETV